MLAVSSVNSFLEVIEGDVLKNPFEYGFEIHEQLALISLQARLRSFYADGVNTCTLEQLRPGALLKGDFNDLMLDVPATCKLFRVGKLFDGTTDLRTGLEGQGSLPPREPGSLLMAAVGQKAVDGSLLLTGKLKGKPCTVLILSQSRWSQLFFPGSETDSKSKIQKSSANTIVEALANMKESVADAWLGKGREEPMFVVYDVFSDRPKGPRLKVSDIIVPHDNCAVAVTTEESIQQAVGPVLGARARLKRIYEDEQLSKKTKT